MRLRGSPTRHNNSNSYSRTSKEHRRKNPHPEHANKQHGSRKEKNIQIMQDRPRPRDGVHAPMKTCSSVPRRISLLNYEVLRRPMPLRILDSATEPRPEPDLIRQLTCSRSLAQGREKALPIGQFSVPQSRMTTADSRLCLPGTQPSPVLCSQLPGPMLDTTLDATVPKHMLTLVSFSGIRPSSCVGEP